MSCFSRVRIPSPLAAASGIVARMGKLTFAAPWRVRIAGHFNDPILSGTKSSSHREPCGYDGKAAGVVAVVPWNIQGSSIWYIARELRRIEADVVLLQEDDSRTRSGNRNVPRDMAQALDMNWVRQGIKSAKISGVQRLTALTTQATSQISATAVSTIRSRASPARWNLSPVHREVGTIALKHRQRGQMYNAHAERRERGASHAADAESGRLIARSRSSSRHRGDSTTFTPRDRHVPPLGEGGLRKL